MSRYLSKSRFLSGTQCHKKLWLEINQPDLAPPISAGQQWTFDQGHQVGDIAKTFFPGGVEIDTSDFFGAATQTRALMKRDTSAIFEATFMVDGLYARVDVLRKSDNGWDIIEVKSSTSVKDVHVIDVAFQWHLLSSCGVEVTASHLMHVDNAFVHPNGGVLLRSVDISSDVAAALPRIVAALPGLLEAMTLPDAPATPIGTHCDNPYSCPFKAHCWSFLPKHSVFTMPGWGPVKGQVLIEGEVLGILDLGQDDRLTEKQLSYVDLVRSGVPRFDLDAIRKKLHGLSEDLYFFDFETVSPAVPWIDGVRPYQRTPFQYSCHFVRNGAEIQHREFLHEARTDPRELLAERLVEDLKGAGHIIVYNASFERSVLMELAVLFPALSNDLLGIVGRLWDLLPIIKEHVHHPDFLGSNSIKYVLPVLVPELTYEGMTIANGEDVGAHWVAFIEMPESTRRTSIRNDILAYCHMDTLAMVKIWEYLKEISRSRPDAP